MPNHPTTQPPNKLLDQVRDVLREKHYSIHTERSYVDWITRFIRFHNKRHPCDMGAAEINAFLIHLASDLHVAASTQEQATSALLFLYREVLEMEIGPIGILRSQKPAHRPDLLTHTEVKRVLDALAAAEPSPAVLLIVQLLYGAGLRLIEALRLRVGDVDFAHRQITVRDDKGKPDHVTVLPVSLVRPLQNQLQYARTLHGQDLAAGHGAVYLPPAVEEEHPDAVERASLARQWRWQYIFPAAHLSTDPRSGLTRRHHLDASIPQKALRRAALSAGIPKRINCRALRDAFAAHLLESGHDVRTVQELLGHRDVTTTVERYTHVLNRPGPSIRSPLD